MRTYCDYNRGMDILPLMMNFTKPSPITISEPVSFTYNDAEQINYEMRIVGTRSLRPNSTSPKPGTRTKDKKNEIDDSKHVR